MPRAERPIDDEETELGAFAADLRRLREKAGKPAYRELASRAHYSAATLADAASGRKLPSLAVTLAYVTACDGDTEEWEKRWRLIASPPDATDNAPYVGLTAFQPHDADRFFGRENLTRKLEGLVAAKPFVGVFGPSGSGKSSLLRAGLVPRLGNALVFTPGALPADECAVRLAQLTGESAVALRGELDDPAALGLLAKQHDVVLVVDQFEEVFTLCDTHQRDWFITALTSAPRAVVGVRADFYSHVIRHPELVEALDGAQLPVGPMTADELRRAITEPAHRVGATVETALLTRLMADVAGQAAALPLVQHALVETWHRRRGMTLTLAGYVEAGGVEHAIARTAETVFSDLTVEQQTTARQIFLRLIALGEGTEDTKRRASRSDLDAEVLEHLAATRLVSLNADHVELSHEALIRSWPRLRDWIAEDREMLRVHHQLTEAAAGWDGDRDLLYKGVRLAQAAELNTDSLTEPERAFLNASQADGRRRVRRTRVVVSILSVLVLLMGGTAGFAAVKTQEASRQRDEAVGASAATQVRWLMQQPESWRLAERLALSVYQLAPSEMNRDLLLSVAASLRKESPHRDEETRKLGFSKVNGGRFFVGADTSTRTIQLWDLHSGATSQHMTLDGVPIAMSDDDRRVIVAKGGETAELLDITNPQQPRKLAEFRSSFAARGEHGGLTGIPGSASGAIDVVVGLFPTTDGQGTQSKLLTSDADGNIRVLEVPGPAPAHHITVSKDGRTIAVVRTTGAETEIWRLDGHELRRVGAIERDNDSERPVQFSPDGRLLLLFDGRRGSAKVWEVADPAKPVRWAELAVPAQDFKALKFSADGRRVALGTMKAVRVWDLEKQGVTTSVAVFEGLEFGLTGLDYLPGTGQFIAVEDARLFWHLRTDVGQIVAELCGKGGAALSDEEWTRYFQDVERVPVC